MSTNAAALADRTPFPAQPVTTRAPTTMAASVRTWRMIPDEHAGRA